MVPAVRHLSRHLEQLAERVEQQRRGTVSTLVTPPISKRNAPAAAAAAAAATLEAGGHRRSPHPQHSSPVTSVDRPASYTSGLRLLVTSSALQETFSTNTSRQFEQKRTRETRLSRRACCCKRRLATNRLLPARVYYTATTANDRTR